MSDIDKIIAERGKTHGDFGDQTECAQDLKKAFYNWAQHNNLTPYMKEAVEMIFHKLARVATGDPFAQEHWDDIAGYATLVSGRAGRRNKGHTITETIIAGEVRGLVPDKHNPSPAPMEPGSASARD